MSIIPAGYDAQFFTLYQNVVELAIVGSDHYGLTLFFKKMVQRL